MAIRSHDRNFDSVFPKRIEISIGRIKGGNESGGGWRPRNPWFRLSYIQKEKALRLWRRWCVCTRGVALRLDSQEMPAGVQRRQSYEARESHSSGFNCCFDPIIETKFVGFHREIADNS